MLDKLGALCDIMGAMDRESLFTNLNQGMLEEKARALLVNLQKNRELISRWGGLAPVVDSLKGKRVIVVGAGPSLEGNIPLLATIKKRQDIAIISADMALGALIANGIFPHYVITCETTPVAFFSGAETSSMHLLAFSSAFHRTIRSWQGKISFYNWMMDSEFYDSLADLAGRGLGAVATGSIVTTQAVSIALGCDIRSLVLLGNDMAFSHSYYARGTISHRRILHGNNRLATVETSQMGMCRKSRDFEIRRGNRSFYTNNQFLGAKVWLEDIFKAAAVSVFDCSDPGCSGVAVEKKDFFEIIRDFKPKRRKRR